MNSPPSADRREKLVSGNAVQVYSKRADKWLTGHLTHVNADMVTIRYLDNNTRWCEKNLPRTSESFRVVVCEEAWRSELQIGQTVEVYSKSACMWLTACVIQVSSDDVVKVKYAVGAHWFEKEVLRTSESLRLGDPDSPENTLTLHSCRGTVSRVSESHVGPMSTSRSSINSGQESGANTSIDIERPPSRRTSPIRQRPWTTPLQPPPCDDLGKKAFFPKSTGQLLDSSVLIFGTILGAGAYGAVYRGNYLGEDVAIKKLHNPDGDEGTTILQLNDFSAEVANLQALKHPRLVAFVGVALVPPSICLVTELMPNGSLHNLLHNRKMQLSPSERHKIVIHMAEGVDFLHSRNPPFVHRDLKSLNVVLDMELNTKLCDFGLTKSMEKTHITRKESEAGSPRYMAPEILDSMGKITEKVDVWALGCLATEVFTGRLPHSECTTYQQVIASVLINKELPYRTWTGMSEREKKFVLPCFNYDPCRRVETSTFLVQLRALH